MCRQAISHEDKETNTKVYMIEISIIIRLLAQTRTFPSPPTVMVAILQVNNLILTFLIHPAKFLLQYTLRLLMTNQRIPLMLLLEWPQENTPTTSLLIPVMIL